MADGARPRSDAALGLTTAEVERRRAAGEGNDYRTPTSRTYLEIVKDNSYPFINGPLLLVSAALISFGAVTEALMTGLPVFGNIAIGVVQGSRAKRQLDRVALLSQAQATVVRDGVEQAVPPAAVVLGDIVVAARGDEIQLDGRIVGPATASLDESALTGESRAVDRSEGDPVRSGSAVVSGIARYEVEAVGADTFANRILSQAKGHRDVRTPLQSDIARAFFAVGVLIVLAGAIVVLTFPTAIADATQDTVFAAAVLVTLVPQGLALMLTVTYAAAAVRISRLGALAQRQSAIEAISRIDTFCSDKTGTLTTQRIAFGSIEPVDGTGGTDAPRSRRSSARSPPARPRRTRRPMRWRRRSRAGRADHRGGPFASSLRWSAIRFAPVRDGHPVGARNWLLGCSGGPVAAMPAEGRRSGSAPRPSRPPDGGSSSWPAPAVGRQLLVDGEPACPRSTSSPWPSSRSTRSSDRRPRPRSTACATAGST